MDRRWSRPGCSGSSEAAFEKGTYGHDDTDGADQAILDGARTIGRPPDHPYAFCSNPTIAWAPEGLSIWYGLRIDRAHSIVAEFAQCGIVQAVPDRAGYFRWDQAQDFALPHGREGRGIVCDRWTDQVVGTPGGVRADRRPP